MNSLAPCGEVSGSIGSLCGCVPKPLLCINSTGEKGLRTMGGLTQTFPNASLGLASVRAGRRALCKHGSSIVVTKKSLPGPVNLTQEHVPVTNLIFPYKS